MPELENHLRLYRRGRVPKRGTRRSWPISVGNRGRVSGRILLYRFVAR